jgi:hypothetical protein
VFLFVTLNVKNQTHQTNQNKHYKNIEKPIGKTQNTRKNKDLGNYLPKTMFSETWLLRIGFLGYVKQHKTPSQQLSVHCKKL